MVMAVVSTFTTPSSLIVPPTEPMAESGLGLYAGLARSTEPAAESLIRGRLLAVRELLPCFTGAESAEQAAIRAKPRRNAREYSAERLITIAGVIGVLAHVEGQTTRHVLRRVECARNRTGERPVLAQTTSSSR